MVLNIDCKQHSVQVAQKYLSIAEEFQFSYFYQKTLFPRYKPWEFSQSLTTYWISRQTTTITVDFYHKKWITKSVSQNISTFQTLQPHLSPANFWYKKQSAEIVGQLRDYSQTWIFIRAPWHNDISCTACLQCTLRQQAIHLHWFTVKGSKL